MRLWRRRSTPPSLSAAIESGDLGLRERHAEDVFVCTTCGRTDLPEAGGWDPPICLECDAAINEDALRDELGADDADT